MQSLWHLMSFCQAPGAHQTALPSSQSSPNSFAKLLPELTKQLCQGAERNFPKARKASQDTDCASLPTSTYPFSMLCDFVSEAYSSPIARHDCKPLSLHDFGKTNRIIIKAIEPSKQTLIFHKYSCRSTCSSRRSCICSRRTCASRALSLISRS